MAYEDYAIAEADDGGPPCSVDGLPCRGRGRGLTASAHAGPGEVTLRLDNERDHAFWAEVVLDVRTLRTLLLAAEAMA